MLPKETAPRKVLLEGGGLKQASQRIPRGAGRKLGQAKEGRRKGRSLTEAIGLCKKEVTSLAPANLVSESRGRSG